MKKKKKDAVLLCSKRNEIVLACKSGGVQWFNYQCEPNLMLARIEMFSEFPSICYHFIKEKRIGEMSGFSF